jgi:carbohydrate-binding DOMON domain-containing protein
VGQYKDHGWRENYLNRKFFIDIETGKVVGTTALKARLTNFNKTVQPTVLRNAAEDYSYKIVTVFEENGQFSSIRIAENIESDEKPYSYQTAVGMHLTGICTEED